MKNLKETWKPVTIGGMTGIMMGAGTMYAVQSMAAHNEDMSDDDDDDELDEGHSHLTPGAGTHIITVSDDMSFSEAFATARAASGPGGLFCWRGNIYGTYYANEWNALSDEDRDLFAQRAYSATAINESASKFDEPLVAENNAIEENIQPADDDVRIAPTPEEETTGNAEEHTSPNVTTWEDLTSDDNDVRIVGFGDVTTEYGNTVTVQELDINGQRVAVIDVDQDGIADLVMTDLNHNREMDEGEVIDLQTGEPLTFTNNEETGYSPADDDMSNMDFHTL